MPVALLAALFVVTPPALKQAIELYDQAQFEAALPQLEALVHNTPAGALTRKDALTARRYLGYTLFWSKRQTEAKTELRALFAADPQASINANDNPPELVAFFNSVKKETRVIDKPTEPKPRVDVVEETKPPPVIETKPVEPPPPVVEKKIPVVERTFVPAPWYLKIIPFGVGQFANHDPVFGAVYLGLDAVALGASLTLTFMRLDDLGADGKYSNAERARTLQLGHNIASISLYALLAWNIIDAFVLSDGRAEARQQRMTFLPLPGGASFAMTY